MSLMDLTGKHILVTGGAGFIGSHLVQALEGSPVRILDDFSTGKAENLEAFRNRPDVEVIRGDVRNPADALRGVDVVFHLACRGVRHSIGNPGENHEVNATGTLRMLLAARQAGVQRFVHVSSSEVYGTARHVPMTEDHPCFPETVYGAAKLAGEAYARAFHQTYGLPTIVVRPFNNFGPRSHHEGDAGEVIPRFVVWALNNQPPLIFGDGKQTRDFLYVEETAYWLRRIGECDALVGQTINLGSGKETSVQELASIICEETGHAGLVPRYHPRRTGDVERHRAGIELAQKSLGFQTRISLREGIQKLIGHFTSRNQCLADLLKDIPEVNWTDSARGPA